MTDVSLTSIVGDGEPIGSMRFFPEAGDEITDSGGYRIRTGKLVTASSYPEAAAYEHLKASGLSVVNSTSTRVVQSADNGAGTVVLTFAGATTGQVLVSTDNGANYSVVATALSSVPTGVIWNGSRFIIVGNDGSTIHFKYSTNGTSWSGTATQAQSGGGAGTARIAWNGSLAYGLVSGSSGSGTAFSTIDGVSITARVSPSPTGIASLIAGGSTFLVLLNAGTTAYTTSNGSSYTTITLPSASVQAAYLNSTWAVKADGTGIYYTSTNLSAWTQRVFPGTNAGLTAYGSLTFDSSRAYAGLLDVSVGSAGAPAIMWTTDLISWKLRSLSAGLGSNTSWYAHAGKYFFPIGANNSSTFLRTADFSVADYVGHSMVVISGQSPTNGPHSGVGYIKLTG